MAAIRRWIYPGYPAHGEQGIWTVISDVNGDGRRDVILEGRTGTDLRTALIRAVRVAR